MNSIGSLRRAALIAFITSLVVLGIKFAAYLLTGSKAVLSDAIESIINVITGGFLMLSIAVSTMPADESHPYGHGKIEAFSAGLEGGLIILAGVMILLEAVPAFFAPRPPENIGKGMGLLITASVINMMIGLYLLHSGKKLKSDALAADGRHLMADFYTSAGVLIGLVLVRFTHQIWLDPLVACLVAINILLPGIKLVGNSTRNLMNEADPEFLKRVVSALNQIKEPGWHYPHKLRSIRSGRYYHVDLHVIFPRYWSLEKVHAAEEELSQALFKTLGEEGDIMIHADPCEALYCHECELASCSERAHDSRTARKWTVEEVVAARSGTNRQDKKNAP